MIIQKSAWSGLYTTFEVKKIPYGVALVDKIDVFSLFHFQVLCDHTSRTVSSRHCAPQHASTARPYIVNNAHSYHGEPSANRDELLFQGYRNFGNSQSWTRSSVACCKFLLTLKMPRKPAFENVSAKYSCKLFKPIFAYRQTVWTLIRMLLEEQSDLGPHCLQK